VTFAAELSVQSSRALNQKPWTEHGHGNSRARCSIVNQQKLHGHHQNLPTYRHRFECSELSNVEKRDLIDIEIEVCVEVLIGGVESLQGVTIGIWEFSEGDQK